MYRNVSTARLEPVWGLRRRRLSVSAPTPESWDRNRKEASPERGILSPRGDEGREDRDGGRGRRGLPQRHVQDPARCRARGARLHRGQDAALPHQDLPGRSCEGRGLPLRPQPRPHRLPLPLEPARSRVDGGFLEPGEEGVNGELVGVRRAGIEAVRELVLSHIEPCPEHEAQIVQGGEPAVELLCVEAVAARRLCESAEILEAQRFKLGSHQGAELALDLLVLVGPRAEALERGILRLGRKQLFELGREAAQEAALLRAQPKEKVSGLRALDGCGRLAQSWRRVAQRPCAWRRATSCSAFSRVPLETTAFPSWCTWSMSSVAFARL